jgi:hypothetical protein
MKTELFKGTLSEIRKYLKGLHYSEESANYPDGLFYLGLDKNLITNEPMVGRENAIKDLKTLLNNGPYVTTEFCLLHEKTNEPAMKLKNVTITVAGVSGTGKGYISAAIYKALLSIGFDTSWVDEETTGESKMQTLKEVESIMHNNNGFNSLPFSTKNIKVEIKPEHLPRPDPEPNNVLKCIDAINAAKAIANVPEEAPVPLQDLSEEPLPGYVDQEVYNSPLDALPLSSSSVVGFESNPFSHKNAAGFNIDAEGRALISSNLSEIVAGGIGATTSSLTPSRELYQNLVDLFSVYFTLGNPLYPTRKRALIASTLNKVFNSNNPPGCLAIAYCPNSGNNKREQFSIHVNEEDALKTIEGPESNFNYFTYLWITPRLSNLISQVRGLDFSKVITIAVIYGDNSGRRVFKNPTNKEHLIRFILSTNETDTVTITETEVEELMEEPISNFAELNVRTTVLEVTVPNVEDFLLTEKYRQTGRTITMFKKIIDLVTRTDNTCAVVVLRDDSDVDHWSRVLNGLMSAVIPAVKRIHLVNMRTAKDSGLNYIRSHDRIEYGISVDTTGEITGIEGAPYTVFFEHDVLREQLIDIKKQLEFYSN